MWAGGVEAVEGAGAVDDLQGLDPTAEAVDVTNGNGGLKVYIY